MRRYITGAFLVLLVISVSVLVVTLPGLYAKERYRIEVKQALSLDLLLTGTQEIELVFFGYAGCADICTPRLSDLGRWYGTLAQETREKVGVKFIDLSAPESRELPQSFAEAFHEEFQGLYLDESDVRRYSRAFSVYFSPSLTQEGELNHTAHLYLLKRDSQGKKLRFIYTAYPYDLQQIHSDIKELIHE